VIEIQDLGYCHKDIKPSNILINLVENHWDYRDDHNLVITDFGLCSKIESSVSTAGTPGGDFDFLKIFL
jgi:serine/threonine protein kinase